MATDQSGIVAIYHDSGQKNKTTQIGVHASRKNNDLETSLFFNISKQKKRRLKSWQNPSQNPWPQRLQTPELHLAERKTTRKHGLGVSFSHLAKLGKWGSMNLFVYGNVGLWLAYGCLNGLGCHIYRLSMCKFQLVNH